MCFDCSWKILFYFFASFRCQFFASHHFFRLFSLRRETKETFFSLLLKQFFYTDTYFQAEVNDEVKNVSEMFW
jgi:hypothetical protein